MYMQWDDMEFKQGLIDQKLRPFQVFDAGT